ncbi:WXG100 family type VII secretion target [Microbacterium sp. YY-03]|uniref:WXG100 family type VII secretion target n=1 Tax=Microbacterium sp. YY-03 TaxID=3421636 RepID=UPI003D1727F0
MAIFAVDSDAVVSATATARATAERVRTDVASLVANLQALQGSWSGSASIAFQEILEMWRGTQREVDSALDRVNLALDSAARQYSDAEQANLSLFRM